jgi:hypothetical protein
MIWAPDKEWAEMVIRQVSSFPKGKHDDLCFVAGTKIATKRGSIPIEDVTTNDYALTPVGWRRVVATGLTGNRQIVERRGLRGTCEHPVFTFDLQYQPLWAISEKSKIVGLSLCDLLKTTRLRKFFSMGLSTDEWAEGVGIGSACRGQTMADDMPKGFMSRSGSITTGEMFRHCMMYITEIMTCLTLSLTIWSAYRAACIGQWLKSTFIAKLCLLILINNAQKRRNGINQKLVENGISKLLQSPFLKLWRRLPLSQKAMIDPFSGPAFANGAGVNLNLEINAKFCARQNANLINPISSSVGAGEFTLTTHPVYNLTVEGAHCYYANGILVHNCDTVSQAIRWLRDVGLLTRSPERLVEIEESMRNISPKATAPLYAV